MAVKIELSFQGFCQKPLEAKSAANGLLSGSCVYGESFFEFNRLVFYGF